MLHGSREITEIPSKIGLLWLIIWRWIRFYSIHVEINVVRLALHAWPKQGRQRVHPSNIENVDPTIRYVGKTGGDLNG